MILVSILIATVLSGMGSLIGGVILLGKTGWVHKFSIHFVSFATGTLLATAFLDLLPEALDTNSFNPKNVLLTTLLGIVVFFIFERIILKFHSHYGADTPEHGHAAPTLLMFGDSVHNFIDGVAIAASFLASPSLGILTSLAVAAHELPQEIGDFSILIAHGWKRRRVLWVNVLISLTSIAGGILAFTARSFIEPILPYLLALTAGNFIYIAASDLIPELGNVEGRDKPSHVISLLLLGITVVAIFRHFLEG